MQISILKIILEADIVVKFVLLVLAAMSLVSWAIILQKIKLIKKSKHNTDEFLEHFWGQKNHEASYRKAMQMRDCPVAALFQSGYHELLKAKENGSTSSEGVLESVERALRRSSTNELTTLESRIPFLATTGSSAPFIGLFGTVWGIMNAFLSIGAKGATSLAVVAPGISEALIATAVGLFAAIPAVIGYNYCASKIRLLNREMENFSNDFLNSIKRQMGA